MLLLVMAMAALAGVRLYTSGKRLAGIFGSLGAALLGIASYSMPLILAGFASLDNGKPISSLLGEILQVTWFLFAWSGLMLLSAIPAGLNSAALWFAAPPRQFDTPKE